MLLWKPYLKPCKRSQDAHKMKRKTTSEQSYNNKKSNATSSSQAKYSDPDSDISATKDLQSPIYQSLSEGNPKPVVQKVDFQDNRVEYPSQKNLHQMIDSSPHMVIQQKQVSQSLPSKPNHTGLPDQLKEGMENISGYSLDDVKVHYNSSKPVQLNAQAYAQGTDIHLASGQAHHLPHETWHVIQQKQGRVKPTTQVQAKTSQDKQVITNPGIAINNDPKLEKEADDMGNKVMQMKSIAPAPVQRNPVGATSQAPIQFNLGTYAMAGTSSGALGNFFDTSTFQDISDKLTAYQASASQTEKNRLLKQLKTLSEKWLKDNQKSRSANANTKRDSIRGLLALVNEELAEQNDDAKYFKESKKFEHNLGLYLFNYPPAQTAVTAALNKMSEVMGVQADNSLAGNVFGGNSAKYAGNVGNDINRVMDVVNNGNLREKLTAFYNAALGPFKNMVTEHVKLTGAMDGQNWNQAKQSLSNKGIADEGINSIEARKNQIEDYPNRFGWYALGKMGHQEKMLDLYTAAADPYVRGDDDALKQGQKGIFEKEGRSEAFDLGSFSPEAFNFNFDKFNFQPADLQGDPNGMLNNALNTSNFAKLQTALANFTAATNSNDKLRNYKKMKSLSWTWLKDHEGQDGAETQTKRQSIETLQRELYKVYSGSTRKPADLRNAKGFSAELSEREKDFIQEQDSDYMNFVPLFEDSYDYDKELPWEEGGTRFNPNLKNAWMKKAVKELKMPVVAGPSGTTDRMLTALNFLGLSGEAENFRLGLLGWMLTSNDHSFHEIMSVSKSFGMEYEEGSYAYHNIPPLTVQQIREHVCENGMFPDEIVYNGHRAEFAMVQNEISSGNGDPWDVHATLSAGLQQRLSPAAAASIRVYTGGSYLIQNPAKESGDFMAKQKIKHQVNSKPELAELKNEYDAGNVSLEDLLQEGKAHNAILYNALRDLPNYAGNVYRGQGNLFGGSFNVGQTKTLHKFTSTSKSITETHDFMQGGNFTTPVLIQMQVTSGKDISTISQYDYEEEVLLQPGTAFTVTAVTPDIDDNRDGVPVAKRPYTKVVMTQN